MDTLLPWQEINNARNKNGRERDKGVERVRPSVRERERER
jgi:hypothetical protein